MEDKVQLPDSFKWILNICVDSAQPFQPAIHASVIVNEDLLDECLDMDDLFTLKRICEAVIARRRNVGGE
jgi:hypothetical protein